MVVLRSGQYYTAVMIIQKKTVLSISMLNLILIAYPVTIEDKQKQKMRKQHVVSPGRKVAFQGFS